MSPVVALWAHLPSCKYSLQGSWYIRTALTAASTALNSLPGAHKGLRYSLLGSKYRIFVVRSTTVQAASTAVKARNAAFKLPATKTE